MPLAGSSIRDILMRRAYAPYAQILLQWLVFGPSGHDRRPEGLVIENYTRRLPEAAEASRHIKAIVRTDKLLRHRLHAACRRMQRPSLQHARRVGAALRDPADRVP